MSSRFGRNKRRALRKLYEATVENFRELAFTKQRTIDALNWQIEQLRDEIETAKSIGGTIDDIRLEDNDHPIIELGHGLIEVAEGHQGDKLALIFGKNGKGTIGAPTEGDRAHLPGETLAVITFANIESLDVVLDKLYVIRDKLKGR